MIPARGDRFFDEANCQRCADGGMEDGDIDTVARQPVEVVITLLRHEVSETRRTWQLARPR